MRKFAIICSAVYLFSLSSGILAQTRGPNYHPPSSGGSHSSGGSSSGSSHGPSYHPPSSSGSSHSGSTSHGPSYHPPSSGGSSHSGSSSSGSTYHGPSYHPPSSSGSTHSGSSSSGSTYHGPSYHPPSSSGSSSGSSPVPHGPHYNPPVTTNGHVPHGPRYNPPYVGHTPVLVSTTVIHYGSPHDYYMNVPHHYIYRHWVQYPVQYWYTDGYWDIDGYPYYVHRGYRYRYHPVEMCQYELVDSSNYSTVKVYAVQACSVAYDQCAVERDNLNHTIGVERYLCAEAVDKELESTQEDDYEASPVEMNDAKKAAIKAYLEDMTDKDIFFDGINGEVANCSITKVGGLFGMGNTYNCRYQVNVGQKAYPALNGSVCSDSSQAIDIGCNVGSEKENAGCILKQAILSGYCL